MGRMNRQSNDFIVRTADALDSLEGLEAEATKLRFLDDYPHEQIAMKLGLSVDESTRLACDGLRRVKDIVFDTGRRG